MVKLAHTDVAWQCGCKDCQERQRLLPLVCDLFTKYILDWLNKGDPL